MNFKEFYQNTEQRLTDAILSLWATGDAETQKYLKHILQEEKLLAEPVFQTTFPWEPSDTLFEKSNKIFDNHFIIALDKIQDEEYRFPKSRFPYKHQVESWHTLLNEKKSIAVTTGTGSGKTECFMLPVLYDIYKNCNNSKGINAIFLYPLNALISSQKKRINAWTKSIGGINYAVYNGNTAEFHKENTQREKYPEIISRELIRREPPQILFTNPTMLEYILVRNKDVELLNNSKGKLRWILLDEAHTLTGSAATEMAMLIRRVLDAFEVDAKDVRFAATSATVGKDSDTDLMRFMSGLCGIPENNIKIIKGQRILTQIQKPTIEMSTFQEIEKSNFENRAKHKVVHTLRTKILNENVLKVSEIAKPLKIEKLEDQIHLVDILSETKINNEALFPVRGHFFSRGIGGVFVCTNTKCEKHGKAKHQSAVGTLSTIAGKECNFCGFPLLELVACRSCGKYMLHGQQYTKPENNHQPFFQLSTTVTQDAFYIESEEDDEDTNNTQLSNRRDLFVAKYNANSRFLSNDDTNRYSFTKDAKIVNDEINGEFIGTETDGMSVCPHCGESTHNPMHFRISSSFLNRILSDIILEQTPEAKQITEKMLWSGHKYISFTDSRQGTAKVSALINIDSERNWMRSQVFHLLAEKRKNAASTLSQYNNLDIQQAIQHLENELKTCLPILKIGKQKDLNELQNILKSNGVPHFSNSRMTWKELYDNLYLSNELETLFLNSKRIEDENITGKDLYLKALFFDQFARRLPRERSLENLGLVNITYSDLDNLSIPKIAIDLNIKNDEWYSLLKIAIDYLIRYNFHIQYDDRIKKYSTSYLKKGISIFPNDTSVIGVKSFPKYEKKKKRQNRLCLLICAGLGLHSIDLIDEDLEDKINILLEQIWITLRKHILKHDGTTENEGYKINIEEKFSFELSDKLWLCPVKNRLIDNHFKGYSPWITGNLTEENIAHFKIGEPIQFPYFQYPFNKDENGDFDIQKTKNWIETNCNNLKESGVWNNIIERIMQIKPLFLAGEHSAQQAEQRLQALEKKFEDGKINILSCSTTMEMGVDIGGISVVVMNNVPPSPANYLQRAGRAGRRAETKSLALTFCAANPIGSNAMENPMWALTHKIASPMLSFNSSNVVERHFNAFFLGKFVQTLGGINITETIDVFFFDENPIANQFQTWLTTIIISDFEKSLKYLKDKTPLQDKTPLCLLNIVIRNFEKTLNKTNIKKQSFKNSLDKLKLDFGENSPAYKSVSYQFSQFRHKHIIGYLADEGFIPSAGMPTGVVSFDTTTIEDLKLVERKQRQERKEILLSKPNPSYHITRALTEYAPGNNIVIDGWNYVSAGIILKNEWNESKREIIQACSSCGYQRILEISEQNQISDICPQCHNNSLKGLLFKDFDKPAKFTELIEPTGFSIDLFQPATRNISETSNSQYIEPLLIGVQPWANDATSIYDIRESIENAEILYYNMGHGNGYSICLHCGKTAFDKDSLNEHRRLRGGKSDNDNSVCSGVTSSHGIKENIILGGRFKTDFYEIRFREVDKQYSNDELTIWSLGVILTKTLTGYLGIEESELSFGVKRYDKYRSLFIFDNAKGGAGYSVKFSYYAEDIFNEALNKLKNCRCEKACTKCLIDRSSQWFIQKLDRNKAIEWLEKAVQQTVPKEFKTIMPNLKSVLGTIKEDIKRVKYRNDIDKIWIFIDNNISNWDIDNSNFINDFKKNFDKINLVVNKPLEYSNDDQNRITAIKISSWADFYLDKNDYSKLKPLCQIQLKDNSFIIYYSESYDNSLSEKWGISSSGFIYKTDDKNYLKFEKITVSLPENKINEIFLISTNIIKSNELAKAFLFEASSKVDLKSIMQNQKFEIVYSDRYLKSPLSCLLLIQFIQGLQKELNFQTNSLNIEVQTFNEYNRPNRLFDNYYNSSDRDTELKIIAKNNQIQNITIQNGKPPHYRFLSFKNNAKTIILRPDGGIEHGWFVVGSMPYSTLLGSEIINIRKGVDYPILYSVVIG